MNTVSHFLKYQNIIFWLFWVLTESKLLSSICSLQAIKWYSSSHSLSPFNFFYLFFIKRFFCFFVKTLTENLHPFLKIFLSFSKNITCTWLTTISEFVLIEVQNMHMQASIDPPTSQIYTKNIYKLALGPNPMISQ